MIAQVRKKSMESTHLGWTGDARGSLSCPDRFHTKQHPPPAAPRPTAGCGVLPEAGLFRPRPAPGGGRRCQKTPHRGSRRSSGLPAPEWEPTRTPAPLGAEGGSRERSPSSRRRFACGRATAELSRGTGAPSPSRLPLRGRDAEDHADRRREGDGGRPAPIPDPRRHRDRAFCREAVERRSPNSAGFSRPRQQPRRSRRRPTTLRDIPRGSARAHLAAQRLGGW